MIKSEASGIYDNRIYLRPRREQRNYGIVHKRSYFRPVVGVPLIVRTPETAKRGGSISNAIVEMSDVGPTLAELAGNPVDYEQFAKSLCPILSGETVEHRDFAISECSNEVMYRDNEWKMVINRNGECCLLFHLTKDPNEAIDLSGVPEYRAKEDELRLKLLCRIMQTEPRFAAVVMGENPKNSKKSGK